MHFPSCGAELNITTFQPQLFLLTSSPQRRIFASARAGRLLLEGPRWQQALSPHSPSPLVVEATALSQMGREWAVGPRGLSFSIYPKRLEDNYWLRGDGGHQSSLDGPLQPWWWPCAVSVQVWVAGGWQFGINQGYIKIVRMARAPVTTNRGIGSKGPAVKLDLHLTLLSITPWPSLPRGHVSRPPPAPAYPYSFWECVFHRVASVRWCFPYSPSILFFFLNFF